jgi:hypothetical protein
MHHYLITSCLINLLLDQGLPTTPRTPRPPPVIDLGAQVEQLEVERDKFEDECIQLRYQLTEALSEYNILKGKIDALSQES